MDGFLRHGQSVEPLSEPVALDYAFTFPVRGERIDARQITQQQAVRNGLSVAAELAEGRV